MDSSYIQALRSFATCDVADALLDLDVPHGGYLRGLTMWSPQRQDGPTRLVGPVWTVKYSKRDAGKPTGEEKKAAPHYVDSAPPGSVIFISTPGDMVSACWGGLVTARAKKLGVSGTVVDGSMRDLDEARAAGYTVFARQVAVARPTSDVQVSETNKPVIYDNGYGTVIIQPGDVLHADLNGVVLIPAHLVEASITRVRDLLSVEEIKMNRIHQGISFTEASELQGL